MADLRARLEWALAHEAEMNELAAGAYQHVVQHYHWPTIIAAYQRLYDELLFRPRPLTHSERRAD